MSRGLGDVYKRQLLFFFTKVIHRILSILSDRGLISTHFQSYNGDLSTVRLPNGSFPEIRFFPAFLLYFFQEREVVFMEIDFIQELKKRDELLDGYLRQIEIQEEFIQKQKELIEYLEDHISKITDIVSSV